MSIDESDLKWPSLGSRHLGALREAVTFIIAEFDVAGIAACGSIIRGTPDRWSDLDIYVVNRAPFRQRIQRWFDDVPAEIFVNPEFQIHRYMADEQRDARPMTAHMLATGFIVYDPDGMVERLRRTACRLLEDGPPEPGDQASPRYMIATLYEDAVDVLEIDPHTARLYLNRALQQCLEYSFSGRGRFVPRAKELLARLSEEDPHLHDLTIRAIGAPDAKTQASVIGEIMDSVIGARGFFEWESTPEVLEQTEADLR